MLNIISSLAQFIAMYSGLQKDSASLKDITILTVTKDIKRYLLTQYFFCEYLCCSTFPKATLVNILPT